MRTVVVFLIEDNPADVELVREALGAAELEHRLEVATDFEQAKRRIEGIRQGEPCPDILLMDLNLPKGSGLELLRLFRENTACHGVPVIVVSSSNAARDRDQAAQLGAVNYFRKPTDLDEFLKLGQMVADSVRV